MSIVSVQPKDFILALFIRDDGERFLLGDNGYDFTDSQLHFSANTIENDEVEKQGADGTMLAGQVRRASVQTFDGYVGDATTPKEEIEQMRRAFIAFFLKGHHYRVVYVDCARNAWQRKGGYLVDAPEVKELFQVHPEYHVGLNFEDVNYYSYDENAEGDEITANLVQVAISSAVEGGLVWDEDGAVSEGATVEYITETAQTSGKNISISDAVEAPLKSLEIQGNTTQQTYTGKNLFPCVLTSQYPASSELKVETDAKSGTITFTALGTSGSQLGYFNTGELNASSSYTISMQAKKITGTAGDDKGRFYVRYRTSSDGSTWTGYYDLFQYTPASIGTYYQISGTVSGSKYYQFLFYNYASTPAPVGEKTEYKNIQLVAGSTADYNFEPYVGGTAAPNPDYPQAVQTVTGENVVKICGKNLNKWENVAWSSSTSSATWCFQNGATGAYGSNITSRTSYKLTLPAGTYTAKAYDLSSNIINIQVCKDGSANEVVVSSPVNINSSNLSSTITLTETTTIVVRYYPTNPSLGIGNTKVQIELGSTATAYEPYKGQSYEVDLASKNLFDATNANIRTGYILNNSGVEVSDNTGGYTRNYSRVIPSTTYTISGLINAGTRRVYYYDQNKNFISRSDGSGASSWQFITPANCYFVNVQIYTNTDNSTSMASWQIEKGSSASQFESYWAYELCKIGTYQDYIYKSGGKWYVRKEVGKAKLSSSWNWYYNSSSHGFSVSFVAGRNWGVYAGYCSHATVQESSSTWTGVGKCGWNASNTFWLEDGGLVATSAADFKTWLDSNEVNVYYALATPTDTEITNEALVAQLEAILSQGYTYDGTNNITTVITAGNEQGSLEITYYTKYIVNITAGGYEWEQGGSGGPTVVMNESIDNVYPIWTITGPITNPVLENTTTGEQIEYVGTIGEGQKLIIDMGAQTALLDGLNVLSNVAGEFISLAPGANTLLYSVSNGDTASEIGWSEIVG